jgi:hypothetical protein
MTSTNDHIDHMARAIFSTALMQNRAGEVLQCLFDGGSVTIDAKTGQLVMASAAQLKQMSGPSADVTIEFDDASRASWWRNMLRTMLEHEEGGIVSFNKTPMGFGPGPFHFSANPTAKIS